MEGGEIFAVAVVVGAVLLVLFGVRASKKAGVARNARLREMAARLGLEYAESPSVSKYLPPTPSVAGVFGGRSAKLHSFTRGAGKNRTRWVAARIQYGGASRLKLSIRSQHAAIWEKIVGAFGYKDIVIGDQAFDLRLVIHGDDEEFIKAALIPEVRARILAFWPERFAGRIIVGDGEAVYEEQGSFGLERSREHIEKSFPVLSDLAAIAEVHGSGDQPGSLGALAS